MSNKSEEIKQVVVTDINIGFLRMIELIVKFTIAAVPAAIFVFLLANFLVLVVLPAITILFK